MYMDAFGWSTQSPAAPCPPSCPTDDALLAAFLSASFELHSDGGNDTVSSDAYGLDLPSSQHDLSLLRCQDGVTLPSDASTAFMDSVDMLPSIAGAHDGLLDRFWFPKVPEEPARAAVSNTVFSGYSSTTGGGNISSGESKTYGGHDTEVASPCAVSQPVGPVPLVGRALPPSKRKLVDKYPAVGASASATTTTAEAAAERRRSTKRAASTTTMTSITFGRISGQPGPFGRGYEPDTEAIAQVKEMIYRAAAMRPVNLGAAEPRSEKPRRKNVRISSDPQTVAARLRREKVSERLRALQRLVPGGSKMDTASMLDEAASYLKFLKSQLETLETLGSGSGSGNNGGLLQHYMGINPSSASNSNSHNTVLAFGRDGISGYVKSNRYMQL